jgi:hypothetical protein
MEVNWKSTAPLAPAGYKLEAEVNWKGAAFRPYVNMSQRSAALAAEGAAGCLD